MHIPRLRPHRGSVRWLRQTHPIDSTVRSFAEQTALHSVQLNFCRSLQSVMGKEGWFDGAVEGPLNTADPATLMRHLLRLQQLSLDADGLFAFCMVATAADMPHQQRLRASLVPPPRQDGRRRLQKHHRSGLTTASTGALVGMVVWNAAMVLARQIDAASLTTPIMMSNIAFDLRGLTVLELGASGTGIPGLVAVLRHAVAVVLADQPDPVVISNLQDNIERNISDPAMRRHIRAAPYAWGDDTTALQIVLASLRTPFCPPTMTPAPDSRGAVTTLPTFDVILLCDLMWIVNDHSALLRSCRQLLTPYTGRVLISVGGYANWPVVEHFLQMAQQEPFAFTVRYLGIVQSSDRVTTNTITEPARNLAQNVSLYEMWTGST